MVGRGELGFLLAAEALRRKLMSEEAFGACIWALLLCTVVAPFVFKFAVLKYREELRQEARE